MKSSNYVEEPDQLIVQSATTSFRVAPNHTLIFLFEDKTVELSIEELKNILLLNETLSKQNFSLTECLEKEVKSSMSELKIPSKFAFNADSRASLKEILFMEDISNRALQLQLWAAEQAALICIGNPDSLWSIQLEILDWIRTHSDFLTNSKSAIPNN